VEEYGKRGRYLTERVYLNHRRSSASADCCDERGGLADSLAKVARGTWKGYFVMVDGIIVGAVSFVSWC